MTCYYKKKCGYYFAYINLNNQSRKSIPTYTIFFSRCYKQLLLDLVVLGPNVFKDFSSFTKEHIESNYEGKTEDLYEVDEILSQVDKILYWTSYGKE